MDRGNLTPTGNTLFDSTNEISHRHYVRPQASHQPFLALTALAVGFGMGSTWLLVDPDAMIELMGVGIIPLGLCVAFFRPRE